MFKVGDKVRLNSLNVEEKGLGVEGYMPNPCSAILLNGEIVEVSNVVLQAGSSSEYSLHFFGSAYSFSANFFELA